MKTTCSSISKILAMTVVAGYAMATPTSATTSPAPVGGSSGQSATQDPFAHLPSELRLTGTVRDFAEHSVQGGHPDFEATDRTTFGHMVEQAHDELDEEMKPAFRSSGKLVKKPKKDNQGRHVMHDRAYIAPDSGDEAPEVDPAGGTSVSNAGNFSQWFRDVPGVNASKALTIELTRQPGTDVYVFDDKDVDLYKSRGGFFPINGELLGNSAGNDKNYHFTYELATEFTYREGAGHVFTFTGDDDVFVYIDGKLVIDIGGIHSAVSQTIELDRLSWLEDGKTYDLRFFFAERNRVESNFRIETTLQLRTAVPPQVTAQFD